MHGAVAFLIDPTTKMAAGAQMVSYEEAMGITHIKAAIRTSATGDLPTGGYVAAIKTRQQVGMAVLPLFDRAFAPVGGESPARYPNMPLNATGNRLTSPYIDGWTLRASGFLRQLHRKCGITRAICHNESSLLGVGLAAGTNPDPSGEKANALAPAVAGALWYQAARRWKAAGIAEVYAGFANIAATTGTDGVNPYVGGYIADVYRNLSVYGIHAPYPWTGLAVTALGWWGAARFAEEMAAIRRVMAAHGDTGTIIVSEWGATNRDLANHPNMAAPTYAAITATCPEAYFFQAPGRDPYLGPAIGPDGYKGYGAFQWRNQNGLFIAGPPYLWQPTLKALFAT